MEAALLCVCGGVFFGQGGNLWASPCRFKRILVLISHSQDFLNGVCTNIIHLHNRKLKYYTVSGWRDSAPKPGQQHPS